MGTVQLIQWPQPLALSTLLLLGKFGLNDDSHKGLPPTRLLPGTTVSCLWKPITLLHGPTAPAAGSIVCGVEWSACLQGGSRYTEHLNGYVEASSIHITGYPKTVHHWSQI